MTVAVPGCLLAGEQSGPRTPEPATRVSLGARLTPPGATTAPVALPPTAGGPTAATRGATVAASAEATAARLSASPSRVQPTTAAGSPLPSGGGPTYLVESGDTLFSLARRFAVPVGELAALNRLPASGGIQAGQRLQLPPGMWSDRLNIRVTKPEPGSTVRSPIAVEGSAATFESVVQLQVLAADGTPLAVATTRAAAADTGQHGAFQASLPVAGAGPDLTVRVYWSSPRDGAPLDEVRIPVTLGS